jgi:hypothetical protein
MTIRELPKLTENERQLLIDYWEYHDLISGEWKDRSSNWFDELLGDEIQWGYREETIEQFNLKSPEDYLPTLLENLKSGKEKSRLTKEEEEEIDRRHKRYLENGFFSF